MVKNNFYKNKAILVTGGAGSIGSEIIRKLLSLDPKSVRAFDNNETGLFDLKQELPSEKLRLLIGDVRDKRRLIRATEEVDIIFHAAALKHVLLCEHNPFEAVQTNVVGTQNVIDAALNNEVEKMINISTDKAVNPVNVMGATKLLTERLVNAACYYKGKRKTVFASVRFGNVLNSRGSVIPLFHQQIRQGGPMTITNKKMTRFIMSIPRAVDLVLKTAEISKGGEIFILKMPLARISDLIEVMIKELAPRYGYKPEQIRIKVIGERIGEKLEEELITKDELKKAHETKDIVTILNGDKNNDKERGILPVKDSFLSHPRLLTKKEIRKLLNY